MITTYNPVTNFTKPSQEAKILPMPLIKNSVEYLRKFAGWFQAHASKGVADNTKEMYIGFFMPKIYLEIIKNPLLSIMGLGVGVANLCATLETNIKSRQIKTQAFTGGLFISKGTNHMAIFAKSSKTSHKIMPSFIQMGELA